MEAPEVADEQHHENTQQYHQHPLSHRRHDVVIVIKTINKYAPFQTWKLHSINNENKEILMCIFLLVISGDNINL